MARPNHIETRTRTLGLIAIALFVMIALALTGGATSDARGAPSGTQQHHLHHKLAHHHKRANHHKRAHRHQQVTSGSPQAAPTPPAAPTPVALPASAASTASDPLAGDSFYINPSDSAVIAEQQLTAEGQTAEALSIEKIASKPEATWLTSDSSPSVVPQLMSAAKAGNTVPVFVAYNIPWRDCSQYSSGGAADAADYEQFINLLTSDLGQGQAVVIVEPDALSEMSCLSSSQQQTYEQLISYAVQRIDTDANASVYVDAGNNGWQSAATEATDLRKVLGSARGGFALNVSNFTSPNSNIGYGHAISVQTGGRHYVVDTSRNGGMVTAGLWCNPAGARIGATPTAVTGNAAVDAFLWIKDVGESDGNCNGGPSAGQWWLSDALSLAGAG